MNNHRQILRKLLLQNSSSRSARSSSSYNRRFIQNPITTTSNNMIVNNDKSNNNCTSNNNMKKLLMFDNEFKNNLLFNGILSGTSNYRQYSNEKCKMKKCSRKKLKKKSSTCEEDEATIIKEFRPCDTEPIRSPIKIDENNDKINNNTKTCRPCVSKSKEAVSMKKKKKMKRKKKMNNACSVKLKPVKCDENDNKEEDCSSKEKIKRAARKKSKNDCGFCKSSLLNNQNKESEKNTKTTEKCGKEHEDWTAVKVDGEAKKSKGICKMKKSVPPLPKLDRKLPVVKLPPKDLPGGFKGLINSICAVFSSPKSTSSMETCEQKQQSSRVGGKSEIMRECEQQCKQKLSLAKAVELEPLLNHCNNDDDIDEKDQSPMNECKKKCSGIIQKKSKKSEKKKLKKKSKCFDQKSADDDGNGDLCRAKPKCIKFKYMPYKDARKYD